MESRVKTGCVLMASGMSRRFGSNKLLCRIGGKTMIETALENTEGLFYKRLVLTRTRQVYDLCISKGIDVILHDREYRGEAAAMGIEQMMDMDGCIFCPCDQPLLKRETLDAVKKRFEEEKRGIIRLRSSEGEGTPVLFSKEYFDEIAGLCGKAGGREIIRRHPEDVIYVEAGPEELFDIDTPEDLKTVERYIKGESDVNI